MRIRVTYRTIAKMLVSASPLDGEDCQRMIEEYTKLIEAMPDKEKLALQSAYIFSSKVPPKEREDVFQELVLQVLKAFNHQKVDIPIPEVNETFAYKVARYDWLTWWRDTSRHKPYWDGSLNEITVNEDGDEVELIDTIVGEDDLEGKIVSKLDAQRIWDKLPDTIKPIIKKRLRGEPLLGKERSKLKRYRRKCRLQ